MFLSGKRKNEEFGVRARVSDIKFPIIIPKRNKGHHEVMCTCSLDIYDLRDTSDFVKYFVPLIKNTCFISSLVNVVTDMKKAERLKALQLSMQFLYHLDRSSASYQKSFYEMSCFYNINTFENETSSEMGVIIPVRVENTLPVLGQLSLAVQDPPNNIYFEDILDYIQKYAGVRLYPSVAAEDNIALYSQIDNGKTASEYISILSDPDILKKIGEAVRIGISYPNVYNTYKTYYETIWRLP